MEEEGHKYRHGISIDKDHWRVIFGEDDVCDFKLEDVKKVSKKPR